MLAFLKLLLQNSLKPRTSTLRTIVLLCDSLPESQSDGHSYILHIFQTTQRRLIQNSFVIG